jgi:putative FmdB family regulatory protein
MPIYAYRCADCGHTKDVLQKLSDPVLTTCPACGKDTFSKQLTAAGFQLKGSGWYVTDFRGGNNANGNGAAKSSSSSTSGEAKSESPKTEGPSASSGGSDSAGSCGTACACH